VCVAIFVVFVANCVWGDRCGDLDYCVWGDRCVDFGYCVWGDRCSVVLYFCGATDMML